MIGRAGLKPAADWELSPLPEDSADGMDIDGVLIGQHFSDCHIALLVAGATEGS